MLGALIGNKEFVSCILLLLFFFFVFFINMAKFVSNVYCTMANVVFQE